MNYDTIESLGTFSQKAETNLIRDLLEFNCFIDPKIQRKLAYYPFADFDEKNDLICEIMEILWNDIFSNIPTTIPQKFDMFKDFDRFLTAIGKKGHFIHQFEVFIFGLNIIVYCLKKNKKSNFRFSDPRQIVLTWLMTSSAHDFGLPLEYETELFEKLVSLYKKFGLQEYAGKMESLVQVSHSNILGMNDDTDIISQLKRSIKLSLSVTDSEVAHILKTIQQEKNHGYVSAVLLYKVINEFNSSNGVQSNSKNDWVSNALQLAAGAISVHALLKIESDDFEKYIRRITFDHNPYAYILFIIDNVQDWHRSIVPNQNYPRYDLINISSDDGTFTIDYMLKHSTWKETVKEDVISYIRKQEWILSLLSKPDPCLNIKVQIKYESNAGINFNPIDINY